MPRPDRFVLDPETECLIKSFRPLDALSKSSTPLRRAIGIRLFNNGHLGEAESCLRIAYERAVERNDGNQAACILLDLACSMLDRSHNDILALMRPLVGSVGIDTARAHNVLGAVLQKMCLPKLAARNLERASLISRKECNRHLEACALGNWASAMFTLGDYETADRLSGDAAAKFEELGSTRYLGMTLCNMAWDAVRLRKYDHAYELYERSEAQAEFANNLHLNLLVTFGRAELELLAGDTEAALTELKTAERLAAMVSHGALRTRILVWKSIINRKTADSDIASQFGAAASDLRAQCLETESAIVLLMAGTWARFTSDLPFEHLLAKAHAISRNNPEAQLLEAHYTRIMSALSQSRRRPKQSFPQFLTQAPAILALKDRLKRLIDTEVRIMLEGESGTGKTFLARQLHDASRRRKSPFVVVDCTNLEENLFESKLFGHLRGAFTGAVSNRVGLVEEANKGTLFLDEFGELPPAIQAKLLYTIEEQRYRPVGSRVEKSAEFRVLAATNRDIDQMLETGRLREDLFFRLSGCRIKLPPLRERREDIAPLAEHQIMTLNKRYGRKKTLKAETWHAIARYRWPGNVRELNATLERGFHLAAGRRISVDDLGLGLSTTSLDAEDLSWYSVRRTHLLKVLRMCRGNVSRSAQLLGVNRTTLIYKLKLLDIERPDFDPAFQGQDRRESPTPQLVADQEGAEAVNDSTKESPEP